MRKLLAAVLLLAGLVVAQGTSPDYRQAALSAALLARLQTVAQGAQGEEKLLTWAKTLKDRAEKELGYYRGQDPLVKDLIAEAKARQEKEPLKAALLAQAALALISAERGF